MFEHKEGKVVMDNKRSAQDRIDAHQSILKRRMPQFLMLGMGLFMASTALSAVISINASQNQDNVITLSGDLEASVEYNANGLKIEIPGVEIKLTCDGSEVTEQAPCTIDLAKGDGSSGNTGGGNTGDGSTGNGNTGDGNTGNGNTGDGNTGNGNTGDGNTGNGNTGDGNTGNGNTGDGNTGDGNTEGKYDNFCKAGRNPSFGGGNPELWDQVCNEDGTVKEDVDNSNGNTGGGFETGSGGPNNTDDTCGSQGYDPTCKPAGDSGASTDERELFPQGDDRVVQVKVGSENLDFGSADRDAVYGVKRLFSMPKGKVSVIDFTMAPQTSLTAYCANGASSAPEFPGKWSERCKEDGTPKTVADFCAAGADGAPSFFGEWDRKCNEDRTAKAGVALSENLDPNRFRMDFAESGRTAGGNLHLWVSTERDGERVSEACSYSAFAEGLVLSASVGIDIDGVNCKLEPGKQYFMMLAFCVAPKGVEDYNCTNPNTETGLRRADVFATPTWIRAEQ